MHCYVLIVATCIMFAAPAMGTDMFMHTGDPQIGKGCASAAVPDPMFYGMTNAECMAFQGQLLDNLLDFAELHGVSDIFVAGDLTDNGTLSASHPAQAAVLESVVQGHPNLDFHFVLGNHDADSLCKSMDGANLWDISNTGSTIPHWEEISVGNVRVFSLNANLWAYNWTNCQEVGGNATIVADVGECHNSSGVDVGSCTAGAAIDGLGQADCGVGEVCMRYTTYATSMMTAFAAWAAACGAEVANGTASACFIQSHQSPWNANNANTGTQNSNNNSYANFRTCTVTGVNCSEFKTACGGGADLCDQPIVGFDMMKQFEANAKAGLGSTKLYGMLGHLHTLLVTSGVVGQLLTYSGTTVVSSLDYEFVVAPSTSLPYGSDDRFAGVLWGCEDDGVCRYDVVLATPSGVAIHKR